MPKFELHKVAFVNPADLTETVVLSTILEGAGGATRSFVEEEAESFVTEDNQEIKDSQIYTFTMAGKPTQDKAQFQSWADGTKLSIVGYAYGDALQIDNAYLTFLPNSEERITWKVGARKSGGVGYVDGKLDTEVMMSRNLLNMHYWQEGTTSGIASGWSKTGGVTVWDSVNEEQDFSTTAASAVYFQRDIYFPFEKQLTFFADFTAFTEVTGVELQIQAFDSSDTEIGTATVTGVASTGVASVSRTLPSNTVYVRLRVKIGQDDDVSFKNPGLSIGTSTEYISQ